MWRYSRLNECPESLDHYIELDIKLAGFDPVLFIFLNRHRNRVKIIYWERNSFCLSQGDPESAVAPFIGVDCAAVVELVINSGQTRPVPKLPLSSLSGGG
ncbi:hypothetical protein CXB34_25385 [Pseudomonas amygdali pv. morsprunorum]|nr:hypothetical protein CXB34_25385 [Pseudomonas amygdali pv. morsprunorum]